MKFNSIKSWLLLCVASTFTITADAQESAGKTLAQKLESGKVTINASVRGCGEDIKQHCDGLGKNARKIFRRPTDAAVQTGHSGSNPGHQYRRGGARVLDQRMRSGCR
jgi:hypothetical protein